MRNRVLHRAAQDQQLNLHCLTGSVKQQAQYSRREQTRDCCQHSIGMLGTHSVPMMQSMVGVSIVQEQQSIQYFFIGHDSSTVRVAVTGMLICNDARKEVNPPGSLARVPRYYQD